MAIMTGRVTARIGSGKGGEVREKEGRRQVFALSFSIPDFYFPAPEMRFEPIKSMVSRGLSPMEAERGRRFFKFSRDTHLRLLSRFGTMSVISCKGVTLMRGKVLVGVVERDFHRFLFFRWVGVAVG